MANKSNGANLGFEEKLWQAADKLRSNMDASEYKHVVLGLIFLKYISDAFNEVYQELVNDPEKLADPDDIDEYKSKNVFWVPRKARWDYLQKNAKQPTIGRLVDDAMDAIERDNPNLKGVLPKNYAREALDKQRLGELIDLIGTIGLGDKESRSKDILGRVYEYFLGKFAAAEGKKGGQFYTPRCVVKLLVEILEPFKGRIYDPCCGSSGMFVQSEKFIQEHGGKIGDISIYGQESNQTTWRLAIMNLAIRGIDANIQWGDSFTKDLHKDLKTDFILANPPFNDSDWKGDMLREDVRWKYGVPPTSNANFAWVQHFIYHLSSNGKAGFVLGNGSLVSDDIAEAGIRKNIIEKDLVECIIALPDQLFYATDIPACLWFLNRSKAEFTKNKILFIDARRKFVNVDRKHKELTESHISEISGIYHNYTKNEKAYRDIRGFCKIVDLDKIREHNCFIAPGRFIDIIEPEKEFDEIFKTKIINKLSHISIESNLDKFINDFIFYFGCYKFEKLFLAHNIKNINWDNPVVPHGWEVKKIGDLLVEITEKNKNDNEYPVFSVTKNKKFVLSDEHFNKQVYSTDLKNYKIVRRYNFAFNPARINIGSIGFLDFEDVGLVSPAYTVFKCKDNVNPYFVWYLINSYRIFELIKNFCIGTVRQVFRMQDFDYIRFAMPPSDFIDEFIQEIESMINIKKNNEINTLKKYKTLILDAKNNY